MNAYTQNCSRSIAGHPAGLLDILADILSRWMKNQRLKIRLACERRQLLAMSDEMLRDIGITRADAEAESARTDIPKNRLC